MQNNEEITIKEANEAKDKNPINSIDDLNVLKNKIHVKQKINENAQKMKIEWLKKIIFPFLRYILNDTNKENIEEWDKKMFIL